MNNFAPRKNCPVSSFISTPPLKCVCCITRMNNEYDEKDNFPTLVDTQLAVRRDYLNSIHMRTVSLFLSLPERVRQYWLVCTELLCSKRLVFSKPATRTTKRCDEISDERRALAPLECRSSFLFFFFFFTIYLIFLNCLSFLFSYFFLFFWSVLFELDKSKEEFLRF